MEGKLAAGVQVKAKKFSYLDVWSTELPSLFDCLSLRFALRFESV